MPFSTSETAQREETQIVIDHEGELLLHRVPTGLHITRNARPHGLSLVVGLVVLGAVGQEQFGAIAVLADLFPSFQTSCRLRAEACLRRSP